MTHLTLGQRYKIEFLVTQQNYSQAQIARYLGVHRSSISREVRRCKNKGKYDAVTANNDRLFKCQRGRYKLKGELLDEVIEELNMQNSPEQISGRRKMEGKPAISPEAIYLWVYENKREGGECYLNLRQAHVKRRKRLGKKDRRGVIPNKVMIDERPVEVSEKSRLGDYEADTIIGANHQGAIVTLTERVTKLLLTKKVKAKTAKEVEEAIVTLLKRSPIPAITITFDNGTEFANHEKIAKKLNCQTFFAHPYHSWERGLNENTNGLIRQYIPKKTKFEEVSHHLLRNIENNLNNRPRKTLGFYSPLEYVQEFKNKMSCCV